MLGIIIILFKSFFKDLGIYALNVDDLLIEEIEFNDKNCLTYIEIITGVELQGLFQILKLIEIQIYDVVRPTFIVNANFTGIFNFVWKFS